MNIALAIKHKYPQLDPLYDFEVKADENGMRLEVWPDSLGLPRPSDEDLEAWYAAYLAEPVPVVPSPEELLFRRIIDIEMSLADLFSKGGK